MQLNIYQNQGIRVSTRQQDCYVNINCLGYEEGLSIDFYPSGTENSPYKYLELREKNGFLRMFCFIKKGIKKDIDLGFW